MPPVNGRFFESQIQTATNDCGCERKDNRGRTPLVSHFRDNFTGALSASKQTHSDQDTLVTDLAESMQWEWGARPPRAQSAAPSRLIVRRGMDEPFGAGVSRSVRRGGAPNYSRGGCAPRTDELHGFGLDG